MQMQVSASLFNNMTLSMKFEKPDMHNHGEQSWPQQEAKAVSNHELWDRHIHSRRYDRVKLADMHTLLDDRIELT